MTEQPPPVANLKTVEDWARHYIETRELGFKLNPPPPPRAWAATPMASDLRPGRPPELTITFKKPRKFKPGSLTEPRARAALHHKFWHHELQAAELMCWALLRFVDTPPAFREGLVRIFRDEVRHMGLYQAHIEELGYKLGDFPVRDWFWDRIPTCQTPLQFVALLGMGLEGANLDHTSRFANWLKNAGDMRGAEIQLQVGREEVGHVRFATRWFREWTGDVDFDEWCRALPAPLSPLLMRGKTIEMDPRLKAEFPERFLQSLAAWRPDELESQTVERL